MRRLARIAALTFLLPPSVLNAMVNGVTPPDTDQHLDAVGAFGVARHLGLDPTSPDAQDNEWFCAATLVRPNTVVLAKHCLSGVVGPFAVRFRRHEDGSIGSIEKGPQSFHHAIVSGFYLPEVGDIALAYLEQPVTHIAPIGMQFPPAAEGPVELAGWGREGPGPGEGPRRELRACGTALQAVWQSELIFPTAWFGPCGPNNNDSGGAVLQGGVLVGVLAGFWSAEPLARHGNDPRFSGRTCNAILPVPNSRGSCSRRPARPPEGVDVPASSTPIEALAGTPVHHPFGFGGLPRGRAPRSSRQ